jgi:hypothetical protein
MYDSRNKTKQVPYLHRRLRPQLFQVIELHDLQNNKGTISQPGNHVISG